MESNWAISNHKRWFCESAALDMPANLENSAVSIGLENVSFHFSLKERSCQRMLKLCTIVLILYNSNVMLIILQARLQQYVNCKLPDVQAGFRKGRGTRDEMANICWIMRRARELQKNLYFYFMTLPMPFTVWITINCGKFWKRWKYQSTWPASW